MAFIKQIFFPQAQRLFAYQFGDVAGVRRTTQAKIAQAARLAVLEERKRGGNMARVWYRPL